MSNFSSINLNNLSAPHYILREHQVTDENVVALANDLANNGIVNPISVWEDSTGDYAEQAGMFVHGDGRQRITAIKLLASEDRAVKGYEVGEIPVIQRGDLYEISTNISEITRFLTLEQMRANAHIKATNNKNYIEACAELSRMGLSNNQIAQELNVSSSTISKWSKTLSLSDEARSAISSGEITLANAQVMSEHKKHFKRNGEEGKLEEKAKTLNADELEEYCVTYKSENRSETNSAAKPKQFTPKVVLMAKGDIEIYLKTTEDNFRTDPSVENEVAMSTIKKILGLDEKSIEEQRISWEAAQEKRKSTNASKKAKSLTEDIKQKQKELDALREQGLIPA